MQSRTCFRGGGARATAFVAAESLERKNGHSKSEAQASRSPGAKVAESRHLALPAFLPALPPGNSLRTCGLASGALRAASSAASVARKLTPSVPARCFALPALLQGAHCERAGLLSSTSRCLRCCQEAHSERASSHLVHFALSALLQRSSLQACWLASGAYRVARVAARQKALSERAGP